MTHSGKIIRTMGMFVLTLAISLPAACAPSPTQTPDIQPSPVSTTPPVIEATSLPAESQEYRNETLGFSFIYPLGALVTEASDQQSILITFPIHPDTNVLEEQASVTVQTSTPCISPLTEGRDPSQLNEQEVVFNGVKFLRHSFNGAAAGTTAVMASYTTEKDAQCLIFSFVLKTFDPANLDPKAFPTPPAMVDWQEEVRGFDEMVSTFTWLK